MTWCVMSCHTYDSTLFDEPNASAARERQMRASLHSLFHFC